LAVPGAIAMAEGLNITNSNVKKNLIIQMPFSSHGVRHTMGIEKIPD
jgi:hypothetical protein